MAKRSPLGTSANFTVNPFNPTETEFHSYWGVYQWDASAAPNSAGGRSGAVGTKQLPNEANNALAAPEFAKLRIGDIAGTAESSAVADGSAVPAVGTDEGLFSCIYAGTVGGGNAVWVRLDNETGATQTVRDAHVIVVAQEGYTVIAGSPPPYNLTDGAGVLADYIDTGNGAQFALALLAAAASGGTSDVRLRPCYIDLGLAGSPAVPLTVPIGCRLVGASRNLSEVTSKVAAAASQQIFTLQKGAELLDLRISSYAATGAPGAGTGKAVVSCAAECRIRTCTFDLEGTARTQPWAIYDQGGQVQVIDCEFYGNSQAVANPTGPSIAIVLGPDPATSPNTYIQDGTWRIDGCQTLNVVADGFNKAVLVYNVGGGHISECDFRYIQEPNLGAIEFLYGGVLLATTNDVAPCVTDTRIEIQATEDPADTVFAGIALINGSDKLNLGAFEWTACRVLYASAVAPTIERVGYLVFSQATGAASSMKIETGTINGCITIGGYSQGCYLQADGGGSTGVARVADIRITGNTHKAPVVIGGNAIGIHIKALGTNGQADSNGISNCSCTSTPATGVGVQIDNAGTTNTIVTSNNLSPNGGTGLVDSGTGTEAAHNILV